MTSHRSNETWLGGDPQGKWSNYYELLGLPRGFHDTVVIARVADQLIKRIRIAAKREADLDRLRVLAKSVLDAKSCLTDPQGKERYDAELQAQNDLNAALTETEAGNTDAFSPPANLDPDEDIPLAIPVAIPVSDGAPSNEAVSLPFSAAERPPARRLARRSSRFWLTFATVAVGAGLFAALAFLSKRYLLDKEPRDWQATTSSISEAPADAADDSAVADASSSDMPGNSHRPEAANGHETLSADGNLATTTEPSHETDPSKDQMIKTDREEATPIRPEPAPLTRAEAEALSRALTAARRSLALREFHSAAESLAQAREIARHPRHQKLVERIEELEHYAREFWAGMDDAWKSLSDDMELQVGKKLVKVVDVSPDGILVHVDGQNRRYARDKLPGSLQKSIIESWLDPSAPSSDLIRGAFYATQDPPNRQAAREHWKSAQRRGADVEQLTATLTDSYAVEDLLSEPSD